MEVYTLNKAVPRAAFMAELERLWQRLRVEEGLRAEAEAAGIDVASLPVCPASELFALKSARRGFEPVSTIIVGTAVPLGGKMIYDVWRKVLLPRLQRRFGKDAIVAPKEKPPATANHAARRARKRTPNRTRKS